MIKVYGADVEFLKFNAGEPHVKVTNLERSVWIRWDFENFEEFAYVAFVAQVASSYNKSTGCKPTLWLPYIPFARQDRATTESQPFSLDVFCQILKTLSIDCLIVADPHSSVFESLMQGSNFTVEIERQRECFEFLIGSSRSRYRGDCIIAPDKGAVEKAQKIAELENKLLVTATKTRDPNTGALSNPQIDFGAVEVSRAIIVDDILDFGGTFIQLAKVIKEQKPDIKLDLYITHGLFGGGIDKYRGLFENIYCYNIMNKNIHHKDLLKLSGD